MDDSRRAFLKKTALVSSAVAVSKSVSAQDSSTTDFRRIAVEETFSVPEVLDAMRALIEREPDREPGLSAPPYVVTDTIRALYDLGEGRIAAMNAARVDKQVLSLWSPGVQVFDPAQGTELARLVNDRLVEAIRANPDRLAGLATVAPQDPAAAAQEIERAVSGLGLHGVLINSHTNSEHLDNPKCWPIFEAAQARGAGAGMGAGAGHAHLPAPPHPAGANVRRVHRLHDGRGVVGLRHGDVPPRRASADGGRVR